MESIEEQCNVQKESGREDGESEVKKPQNNDCKNENESIENDTKNLGGDVIEENIVDKENTEENVRDEKTVSTEIVNNDKEEISDNKDGMSSNATAKDAAKDDITDEYHYTKSGEYTSEMFKVVVQNIPPRVTYGHLRQKLKEILGFAPKKMKYNPRSDYAFCALKDEAQRLEAIEKLNNYDWKGSKFYCKKAGPAKDPLIREKKRRATDQKYNSKKMKLDDLAGNTPEEKIVHVVCPFAKYDYEEQLKKKEQEMKEYVRKLTGEMRFHKVGKQWINNRADRQCLELLPIVRSPVQTHYRNKVEFTIGVGAENKDNTIGFRLGSYKDGDLMIAEATNCINCNKTSIDLAKETQSLLQSLPHPSYNLTNHTGLWQQFTVRTCTTGDVMAMLQINHTFLNEEDNEKLKKEIIEYFSSDERIVKVTSLYISYSTQKNNNIDSFIHLSGEKHVQEKLNGLTFRVSPDAFFQVNTPGAEKLYGLVKEWCDCEQEDAVVLDVCCGTGTIGLFIAKGSELPVVGVEISEQAVEDAKVNASLNGIENGKFVCGPAEKVLYDEIKRLNKKKVIAIVDPPRAGLHKEVLQLLRNCNAIQKIIYVSCSPKQALDNFVGFCRSESKRYRGVPFRTVRAVPVDLFPQTPHCELIVQLERVNYST